MFHVVLHVHVTTSEDFETEGTEQVFGVVMDSSEMCLHVWEEGWPVIANLSTQNWNFNIGGIIPSKHQTELFFLSCISSFGSEQKLLQLRFISFQIFYFTNMNTLNLWMRKYIL